MKIRSNLVLICAICFLSGSLILFGLLSPWYKAGARIFSGFNLIENQEVRTGFPLLFLAVAGTMAILVSGVLIWLTDVDDTKKLLSSGLVLTGTSGACLLILLTRGLTLTGPGFIYQLPPVFPSDLFLGFWIFLSGIIIGFIFWILLQTETLEKLLPSQVFRASSA